MSHSKKQTIEPADLFRLKFLQGGQLSPDGTQAAYTVSWVDSDKEEEFSAIWLVSLASGESRQLTAGLARDTDPGWSPDGRRIAFLSTRSEKPQMYLIPVDGGEARALTDIALGVSGGPVWSPDGKHIAFTALPGTDRQDRSRPYRVTRHIYRFDGVGYLDDALEDVYIVPAEGGEATQLTRDGCRNSTPIWSPDGQEILFLATMIPDSYRMHPVLKAVNLDGEVRELVGTWGYATAAAWTPDGQAVVFVGNPLGLPAGTQDNLWVIGRRGGTPEGRTAGLGLKVGGSLQMDMPVKRESPAVLVTKDGQSAYVQVQDGGTVPVYRIALDGRTSWTPIVTGERSCIPLDMNEDHLLFSVSTLNNPTDLFVARLDGSAERQLTCLNGALFAQRALPTVERLSFPSTDGVQVEGWALKPSHGVAPYPAILYAHGGPHSGFGHMFSFDFQMLAGAGYAVLFINQRGSTGYGDAFASQIIGDWGNLDYEDQMAGVDLAVQKGIADPDRLGCCGLSAGGFMTCWIVGHTDRFAAAVAENPVSNRASSYGVADIGPFFAVQEMGGLPHEIPEVYWRCSPLTYAHRCTTPTLLIQGEADYRCPAEQGEQFYAVLKASGCVVEMLRLPGSSHAGSIQGPPIVRRAQNEALLDWMNRYVLHVTPDRA